MVQVRKLQVGTYSFELMVTDDAGLTDKDTVTISVNDALQTHRPPVANAGKDFSIALPMNAASLDGSASTDPDSFK